MECCYQILMGDSVRRPEYPPKYSTTSAHETSNGDEDSIGDEDSTWHWMTGLLAKNLPTFSSCSNIL